jgi:Flp pilus assembly protein TadG
MQKLSERIQGAVAAAGTDREGGAIAVIVAVLMVALLGFAALAIDTGQVAAEKAQLQNGADAAALAIAQSCSKTPATCNGATASALATKYVPINTNDRAGVVASGSPILNTAAGTVRVDTSTPGTGLALTFARIWGSSSIAVQATATAAWGGPLAGPAALPLVFAPCKITPDTGATQYLYLKNDPTSDALNTTCPPDSTAHGPLTGGFLWAKTSTTCSVTVATDAGGAYIMQDTGVNVPSLCKTPDAFAANLNKVVLLPIFSGVVGNGAGGKYYVQQWAAVTLIGYRFNSGVSGGVAVPGGSSSRGIAVKFVSYVADPTLYSGGGLTDDGVNLPPHLTN